MFERDLRKVRISRFFLSKIKVFVVVRKNNVDNVWGRCWDAIPKFASANRSTGLTESECCVSGVCSTFGNVLLGEMRVPLFCSWVICCGNELFCGRNCPVIIWEIVFRGALRCVTMWWVRGCRSYIGLNAEKTPSS